MPKKLKKKDTIFNSKDFEKQCMEFLRSRGFGIFKMGGLSSREEEEAVKKLRAVGYKIEHMDDVITKVDVNMISSVDDIVVYFYEMLKRYNKKWDNAEKRRSKNARSIDRSVINMLINWRIEDGNVSLTEALNEVFLMINVLFDKLEDWSLDVRSTGILSVTTNKPLIFSLLRESRLRQDAALKFEVDRLISQENKQNYLEVLRKSRELMNSITSKKTPARKRNVDLGDANGKKTSEV